MAVFLIEAVLQKRTSIEDALATQIESGPSLAGHIEPRDRALSRLIASSVIRHLGSLDHVLTAFMERPLPREAGRARAILLAGAAQLLLIGSPAHAVINLAVEHCRRDRLARRFDKLANAVLRRVASEGPAILDGLDRTRADIPDWLWRRWSAGYGEMAARRIAEASLREAPLDISVKADPADWAQRLGGLVLCTGSIRTEARGRVEEMPGYAEGAWWVQDAAATLPARLLGPVAGLRVADLCAAPGGKTAQLASAGARVTAVDTSARRLAVLRDNIARLGLHANVDPIEADIESWAPAERFGAVLLDAPCTATGTIRRHPDILRLRHEREIARLAVIQDRLLARAADLTAPGGTMVYCTCSLEPEEGEERIARFLAHHKGFVRSAVRVDEFAGSGEWISQAGDLRTLPFHLALECGVPGGLDGFYAARLRRVA
jgi:16S rRNA (cytosine967-C5)-methyltransferase